MLSLIHIWFRLIWVSFRSGFWSCRAFTFLTLRAFLVLWPFLSSLRTSVLIIPVSYTHLDVYKRQEQDMQQIEKYEIPEIDLVIVDLYPFEATVASGASEADIIRCV